LVGYGAKLLPDEMSATGCNVGRLEEADDVRALIPLLIGQSGKT